MCRLAYMKGFLGHIMHALDLIVVGHDPGELNRKVVRRSCACQQRAEEMIEHKSSASVSGKRLIFLKRL